MIIEWVKFVSIFNEGLARNAPVSGVSMKWDISNGCSKPFELTLSSAPPPDKILQKVNIPDGKIRHIDISCPCRKCEPCLKNRRILWRRRMRHEINQSNRTWFGTFTINPHQRFVFSMRAGTRDYFASYGEISKELTKYFKRLRKAGFKFRYVVVAEAHKDGYPHLHCLIHEVSTPIPKRRLQSEWPHGYTTFKLVEDASAVYYVTKYLSKDARTRIRASLKYGQSVRDLSDVIPDALMHRI